VQRTTAAPTAASAPTCGGAEPRAREHDLVAGAHIASLCASVFSFDNSAGLERVAVDLRALDGHDRVGSHGHDRSGRDHDCLACPENARLRAACRRVTDDHEPPGRVGRADGVPVHRRARKRRQVDGRTRVLGENTARSRRDRDVLCLERPRSLEHKCKRLVDPR